MIKALITDFDGCLTDNLVITDDLGHEYVTCSRADSLGLKLLQDSGVRVLVLSSETSPVVGHRCSKLGVDCIQDCWDKKKTLLVWLEAHGIDSNEAVFIGNDINDLGALTTLGIYGVAVADSRYRVKAAAKYITVSAGGRGAVREVCDAVLEGKIK